jgi:hypothetical protein
MIGGKLQCSGKSLVNVVSGVVTGQFLTKRQGQGDESGEHPERDEPADPVPLLSRLARPGGHSYILSGALTPRRVRAFRSVTPVASLSQSRVE